VGPHTVRRLEGGILLDGQPTAPAKVTKLQTYSDGSATEFHLTLIEGRKRQIRLVCEALGHPVRMLVRIRMGPLRLGAMPEGSARPLGVKDHRALSKLVALHTPQSGSKSASKPQDKRRSKRSLHLSKKSPIGTPSN
jgi:23S rRNA pseudouridine2605 synthase